MDTLLAAVLALIVFPGFGTETVNFDAFKPGIMPPYWTATATHGGTQSRWEIRRDPHAPTRQNVMAQVSSAGTDQESPLAIYDRTLCRDLELSVKFKILPGKQAKTAGLVFRYQDPNNYYLLNFSADENRVSLIRVQDGQSHPIPIIGAKHDANGVKHIIHANEWYVAKVTCQGSRFRVSFGNRRLFDAVDDGIRVQGKAGLWTKGATTAEFDDFRVSKKG